MNNTVEDIIDIVAHSTATLLLSLPIVKRQGS